MSERFRKMLNLEEAENINDESELILRTVQCFDSLVDLLRDQDRFPNLEINRLVTLMWRIVGNREVNVTLDVVGSFPSISFLVTRQRLEELPLIIIPRNYVNMVHENPIMQLGGVVSVASQVRDYWTGKLVREKGSELHNAFNLRRYAFEAEMLITIRDRVVSPDEQLTLNPYQRQVLREYSQGVKGLSDQFYYSTPKYKFGGKG